MARFGKPATGSWTGDSRERMECIMSKTVRLGRKLVGEGQPTYIIAEIGINHNGDLNIAKEMIRRAAAAGVEYEYADRESEDQPCGASRGRH